MSLQRLFKIKIGKNSKQELNNMTLVLRTFSQKTEKADKYFKPVKRKIPKNENSLVWKDPNFEILASNSNFPLFLPGNIGLAWFDQQTTVQTDCNFVMKQLDDPDVLDRNIVCSAQECPTVLRKTVYDLFPYRYLEGSVLTVITVSLKLDMKLMRQNKEQETERMAQTFVITAKSICEKIVKAGFWADFINPFSGRPFLYPALVNELYKSDEKFRCLDFEIFKIQECKIVSNENEGNGRKFTGSLFTNAPSVEYRLNNIFL